MGLDAWKAQIRKGAAELATLALLARRERYGLEILDGLREGAGLEISEGTIYPLLRRLEKDGKVESRWVEEEGASHPRKYYRLTPSGAGHLSEMRGAWAEHTGAMARLMEGE